MAYDKTCKSEILYGNLLHRCGKPIYHAGHHVAYARADVTLTYKRAREMSPAPWALVDIVFVWTERD